MICGDIDAPDSLLTKMVAAISLGTTVMLLLLTFAFVSFGIYKMGYFVARGLDWKTPPEIQMYEKYINYKQYEDGSFEATLKDGNHTKITGCIVGAICREN